MTADRLAQALSALLNDTQHAEHNCDDDQCPVREAREALAAHRAQAPAEGDDILEPLIYAAMMHNGTPKTVVDFERAAANVTEMLERRGTAQPVLEALPHPGSLEADEMIDELLAEYGHPANAKNAARAGYMAARRLLQHARQPLPAVDDAAAPATQANVQPKGMPAEWLDAFEEWRQTLGAADLDGKRDLVWRHIAGTGFQAGAAWARSQAPAPEPCISSQPDAQRPKRPDDFCPDNSCRAVGRCIRAPAVVDGWQPIETAPKDGKDMLLVGADDWREQAWWDADRGEWWGVNAHWTDAHGGPLYPTHWQPLPAAPAFDVPVQGNAHG